MTSSPGDGQSGLLLNKLQAIASGDSSVSCRIASATTCGTQRRWTSTCRSLGLSYKVRSGLQILQHNNTVFYEPKRLVSFRPSLNSIPSGVVDKEVDLFDP